MLFKHVPSTPPTSVPCALAFVAEAPGDTEVCRGHPLVGPSGKIFDKMLRLAGIDRKECFVGNVFDEQLPENSIKGWCQREKTDEAGPLTFQYPGSVYLQREHEWHFSRIAEELAASQPSVIVPLGATALWAFTGSTAIGESRGAIQRATAIVPGAKLLPTFHPAYVLRQYKMLGTVVADFRKALGEASRSPETLRLSARELWLDPSIADIHAFIGEYLTPADLITIDIETGLDQITKIGFAADSAHAITIPFVDNRQPSRSYWATAEEELEAWRLVQWICALPNPKLLQNGPFDCWHLIRYGISVENWSEDTRLLHHALYPELPKNLAYMVAMYAHASPWKLLRHGGKAKRDE